MSQDILSLSLNYFAFSFSPKRERKKPPTSIPNVTTNSITTADLPSNTYMNINGTQKALQTGCNIDRTSAE